MVKTMFITEVYQLNIYDVTNLLDDPIYQQLQNFNIDEEIQVENFIIRRTQRFYEIENDYMHEGFMELVKCYQFLSTLLMEN